MRVARQRREIAFLWTVIAVVVGLSIGTAALMPLLM